MITLIIICVLYSGCKTVSQEDGRHGTQRMSKPPPGPPFISPGVAPLSPEDVWNIYYGFGIRGNQSVKN